MPVSINVFTNFVAVRKSGWSAGKIYPRASRSAGVRNIRANSVGPPPPRPPPPPPPRPAAAPATPTSTAFGINRRSPGRLACQRHFWRDGPTGPVAARNGVGAHQPRVVEHLLAVPGCVVQDRLVRRHFVFDGLPEMPGLR